MNTFKVMQFNIQFGQGWDEADADRAPIDLDRTISEILEHDADIVALQEVEKAQPGGTQDGPPPNYMRLKAALRAYHSYFSYPKADPRELPFGIGLAIFSKTPLRETSRRDIPSPPIEFEFEGERKTPTDRLLIGARTMLNGREVQIFNTHLLAYFMLNTSGELHPQQRQIVIEEAGTASGPALIMGDFNASKSDLLVRQFADAGFQSVQTKEVTWRRRPYVLDHIFHNRHLRPVSYAVRPTMASDHHIVLADFEFLE